MSKTLVRALVLIMFAGLAAFPAIASPVTPTCSTAAFSSLPFSCVMPEPASGVPEVAATFTLAGFQFAADATGTVVLMDAGGSAVSDFATFSNVGGVATIQFVSDTDGIVLTPPGLPILTTGEGHPVVISLELVGGGDLQVKLCSDADSGGSPCGGSDSISINEVANGQGKGISLVPEPGTFGLAVMGLLGLGPALRLRFGSN